MSVRAESGTVRLSIAADGVQMDLAAPVDSLVAELAATVVAHLGQQSADRAVGDGGWMLQRLGDPPLDAASTLAQARLADGDVLYLRARRQQLPDIAYDDVLDAVASGVSASRRWAPEHTRAALLALGALGTGTAVAALLAAGPPWAAPAGLLGVLALALLGGTALLARAAIPAGAVTAGLLGVLAAAGAAGAGLGADDSVSRFGAVQLLPAAAAALAAAVAAWAAGAGASLFVGVMFGGFLAALGAGFVEVGNASAAQSAAMVAGAALLALPLLPITAFRLARLTLPPIPVDAADLRRGIDPVDGLQVLGQAARADRYLTGLILGAAGTVAGCAVPLVGSDGTGRGLAAVLAAVLLLRARIHAGLGQRAALLGAGAGSALAAGVAAVLSSGAATRIVALAVPAALLALGAFGLTRWLPGARLAPPWGRAADVLEGALVMAVLPLVLAVMGVYGAIRDLTS